MGKKGLNKEPSAEWMGLKIKVIKLFRVKLKWEKAGRIISEICYSKCSDLELKLLKILISKLKKNHEKSEMLWEC